MTDETTYGMCLACRSIEVALVDVIGTRDFSSIGESAEYPRDEASDGPGERVVTGDLDEHRDQAEDNRRWRRFP